MAEEPDEPKQDLILDIAKTPSNPEIEEEEDVDKPNEQGSSGFMTTANFINSILGAPVCAVPTAFCDAGIAYGTLLLVLIATISHWANVTLVAKARRFKARNFEDLTMKALGPSGFWAINIALWIFLFSFSIVFLKYGGEFIGPVICGLVGDPLLSEKWWFKPSVVFVMASALFPVLLARDLGFLGPAAVGGVVCVTILTICSYVAIFMDESHKNQMTNGWHFVVDIKNDHQIEMKTQPLHMMPRKLHSYLASIGFILGASFGQYAVLDIWQSMSDKSQKAFTVVSGITQTVVLAFNAIFGIGFYIMTRRYICHPDLNNGGAANYFEILQNSANSPKVGFWIMMGGMVCNFLCSMAGLPILHFCLRSLTYGLSAKAFGFERKAEIPDMLFKVYLPLVSWLGPVLCAASPMNVSVVLSAACFICCSILMILLPAMLILLTEGGPSYFLSFGTSKPDPDCEKPANIAKIALVNFMLLFGLVVFGATHTVFTKY